MAKYDVIVFFGFQSQDGVRCASRYAPPPTPSKKRGHIVCLSVGRSIRLSVGRQNGFRSLSGKLFITGLLYLTC